MTPAPEPKQPAWGLRVLAGVILLVGFLAGREVLRHLFGGH